MLLGRKPQESEALAREWPVPTLLVPACRGWCTQASPEGSPSLSNLLGGWHLPGGGRAEWIPRDDSASRIGGSEN